MTDLHDNDGVDVQAEVRPATEPGSVEDLVEELIEIITSAKSMPLSSSAIVTRATRCSTCWKQFVTSCPRSCARPAHAEGPRGASRRRGREAADIVGDARVQAERMVQRTEIVRQAEHRAVRIVEDAEAAARQMRHEAEDYVDQKLAGFEIVLDRTIKTVRTGRERLASIPAPQPQTGEEPEGEPDDDEWLAGEGFFDQDLE